MSQSAPRTYRSDTAENLNTASSSSAKRTYFFSPEQSFFQSQNFGVQPKLTVNAPDDKYEWEADRVADAVMRIPDPQVQRQSVEEEEEMFQMKEDAPAVQRKCTACEAEESLQRHPMENENVMLKPIVPAVQRKCTECEAEAEEKLLRKPLAGSITPFFQRKEADGAEVNPQTAASLQSTKGGGHALPYHSRNWMESRFGADFSHVKIHTDSKAVQLSRDLNAQAFTHGSDVYFNKGKFSPRTSEGKRLLAHELTHVLQQSAGTITGNNASLRPMILQRKPLPNVPLGDFEIMFNPSASVIFTPPGGSTETRSKNEAVETFTFTDIPRGASGQVRLDVAMQWFGKALPPGKRCDLCGILANVKFLGFPIFPDAFIEECRERLKIDPNEIKDILLNLMELVGDPCGKLIDHIPCPNIPVIEQSCELGKFGLKSTCRTAIAVGAVPQGALLDAIKEIRRRLEECQAVTPRAQTIQPAGTGQLVGGAQSRMRATFFSEANGSMHFSGLLPTPFQFGEGARLIIPVAHLHTSLPRGGEVAQQPTVTTTTGKPGVAGKLFTVVIQQPADANYTCKERFGPFKVNSDKFEQDDEKHQEIRNWYFGLHPQIRQDIEQGTGLIRVTGRASKTGSQAHNMKLAEKRAKRVHFILSGLAGSDAQQRLFFLGELGAQTPGCNGPVVDKTCEDADERRVDVVASGIIPGAGVLQNECFGHQDEPTPTGATQPFFEAGQ